MGRGETGVVKMDMRDIFTFMAGIAIVVVLLAGYLGLLTEWFQ
jgi:hypothetical protein